jgi:hypothetical protein
VTVEFSLSPNQVGGESIEPLEAVSNASGLVQTVLTSGTRTTTVRVVARVVADPAIFAQSTAVSIVGAPPAFDRFSLAAQFVNVSGRVTLGIEDQITAFLNDRFGNAVPEGTSVSFTTNGGSIVSAVPTDAQGRASAVLLTEGGAIPPDGVVRVLAVTRGEEPFVDANGNGEFDTGESFTDVPEPFIDNNGNGVFDPADPFERFIDTNENGTWDVAQGPGVWNDDILIWSVIPIVFSGPTVASLLPGSFIIPDGGVQSFTLTISDDLGNPIVGGSTVNITINGPGELLGIEPTFVLDDRRSGGTVFNFAVGDSEPGMGDADEAIGVTVSISSSGLPAGGNGSLSLGSIGTVLAAPTPTPSNTLQPTATDTPTVTPTDTP